MADIHEVGIAPDVEVELDEELRKQVVIEKEKIINYKRY